MLKGCRIWLWWNARNQSIEYEHRLRGQLYGDINTNASQYTGRENDGTGLYYYRNRYYSPKLQRFISEDPIGFGGGINLYAYVGNNPLNWNDPLGLDKNGALDKLQTGLDVLGLIPVVGEFFDLLNAGISWARGNKADALLSLGSANPLGGQFVTAFKWGRKAVKHFDKADEVLSMCFVAGTKVQTPGGEVNIEDIKVGDVVLSSDPERSEPGDQPSLQRVTRLYVRTAPVILDIQVDGEVISATPEHPFWVVGKGWQEASQLERGSQLLTRDGKIAQVGSVNRREGSFKVYNFEVEHSHTYYVSRSASSFITNALIQTRTR